jgi:glycosyltransferase involved in cell wall biosynthesis
MTTSVLMATIARPGWDAHLPDLIEQSVAPDQVVVVIDRPTSAEEQSQFSTAWPDVTFVFNAVNLGVPRALNRGLAVVTGDYVFRADDDDGYRRDRIEKQLALFEATGADLVVSWAEGVAAGHEDKPYIIKCPAGHEAICEALTRRNILIHASLAFRRDPIVALGGYDETFRNAQDYALYLAAMRDGLRFAAVPEPLVRRSYTGNSITIDNRYNQLMYSCAARVVHHAHSGDRLEFLSTLFHYARLAAIPSWARRLRRRIFAMFGRGV